MKPLFYIQTISLVCKGNLISFPTNRVHLVPINIQSFQGTVIYCHSSCCVEMYTCFCPFAYFLLCSLFPSFYYYSSTAREFIYSSNQRPILCTHCDIRFQCRAVGIIFDTTVSRLVKLQTSECSVFGFEYINTLAKSATRK